MQSLIPFPFRKFSAVKFIYDAVSRNSSRVSVHSKKPKKTIYKKIVGIYGPPCDCLNCGGTGCKHCSPS